MLRKSGLSQGEQADGVRFLPGQIGYLIDGLLTFFFAVFDVSRSAKDLCHCRPLGLKPFLHLRDSPTVLEFPAARVLFERFWRTATRVALYLDRRRNPPDPHTVEADSFSRWKDEYPSSACTQAHDFFWVCRASVLMMRPFTSAGWTKAVAALISFSPALDRSRQDSPALALVEGEQMRLLAVPRSRVPVCRVRVFHP